MRKSVGLILSVPLSFALCIGGLVFWLTRPEPAAKPVDINCDAVPAEFQEAAAVLQEATQLPVRYEVAPEKSATLPVPRESLPSAKPISQPEGYNIERTWRIIRALDVAEKESTDLAVFSRHLARQDYSGVPAEVIAAQRKILPIVSRIREIETEYAENEQAMSTLNMLRNGIVGTAESLNAHGDGNASEKTVGLGLRMLEAASPAAAAREAVNFCRANEKALAAGLDSVAKAYNLRKSRQQEIARELKEVQRAYVEYLMQYMPIRRKYEVEWDALCLDKDRAYFEFGRGDCAGLLKTTEGILKKYPYDRESILLRAFALSRMAIAEAKDASAREERKVVEIKPIASVRAETDNPKIAEALELIDSYIVTYPGSSAPALLLKGLIKTVTGDSLGALEALDQAAVEYPREAARLGDILEAYSTRPHLEKTAEGLALLRLHRSLTEGFGVFSPNLEKAFLYERQGDFEKAREEIFNHFFRRSNQEVYHELFSDMLFCEQNLSLGFKGLLLEHSFFDVSISQPSNWYLTKKKDRIQATLKNRTDFDLKNVRLFLCLQFTGMYKGAYDVIKAGTIGQLAANGSYQFDAVGLGREGVEYKDIANVRAIVMTDDRICWVDSVETKRSHAANVMSGLQQPDMPFTVLEYLSAFGTAPKKLEQMLCSGLFRLERNNFLPTDTLQITIPRIFMVLDPVFTIGEVGTRDCLYPTDSRAEGSSIVIRFGVKVKEGETADFCIYSDYLNLRVRLLRQNDEVSIQKVDRLLPQTRQ